MPWDPVRDLLHMHERLESLFGSSGSQWVPPVDLAEFEDRYTITMELPGCARTDVTLEYTDQTLTVRGVRPTDTGGRFHQLERGQGVFCRSFRFAASILADHVTADIVDGILTIVVPKATVDRRRIEVS